MPSIRRPDLQRKPHPEAAIRLRRPLSRLFDEAPRIADVALRRFNDFAAVNLDDAADLALQLSRNGYELQDGPVSEVVIPDSDVSVSIAVFNADLRVVKTLAENNMLFGRVRSQSLTLNDLQQLTNIEPDAATAFVSQAKTFATQFQSQYPSVVEDLRTIESPEITRKPDAARPVQPIADAWNEAERKTITDLGDFNAREAALAFAQEYANQLYFRFDRLQAARRADHEARRQHDRYSDVATQSRSGGRHWQRDDVPGGYVPPTPQQSAEGKLLHAYEGRIDSHRSVTQAIGSNSQAFTLYVEIIGNAEVQREDAGLDAETTAAYLNSVRSDALVPFQQLALERIERDLIDGGQLLARELNLGRTKPSMEIDF